MKSYLRNLRLRFRKFKYKYFCPLCDNRVPEFLPMPHYFRENQVRFGYPYSSADAETINPEAYLCPFCYGTDRDRLYSLYMQRYLKEYNQTLKILEIAPVKALSDYLRRTGRIELRTADLLMEEVDDRIDMTDMWCYAESSYDIFICSHVLEHVPDDRKALSELYRILKPSGWGILMVPILLAIEEIDEDPSVQDEAERWRRFGQNDHVRMYSKKGFGKRVEEAGFVVRQYGQDFFGRNVFKRHGISPKSVLYIVSK